MIGGQGLEVKRQLGKILSLVVERMSKYTDETKPARLGLTSERSQVHEARLTTP
jgi:hypothetical protein